VHLLVLKKINGITVSLSTTFPARDLRSSWQWVRRNSDNEKYGRTFSSPWRRRQRIPPTVSK